MDAIETSGVKKTYTGVFGFRRRTALRGVDLCIPQGTVFGLIGLNGAGKTTFIKVLLAVIRQDAGEVRVLGGSPEDPAIRGRIGYLPECIHLSRALTARGMLLNVGRIKRVRHCRAQADEILGQVGLGNEANTRIGGFSKGMRQRLGLAAALIGRPELLILDEPTDGVDPLGRMDIRRILEQERDRGTTIFINSHLLTETERLASQVGIISSGRLVKTGELEALCGKGDRWRVKVSDDSAVAAMAGAGFAPGTFATEWFFENKDKDALNCALKRAIADGARIVELAPDILSLEEVLKETLDGDAP
jgi:ABC-2 type transport system ATP-binding protein